MILEAFSHVLHPESRRSGQPAHLILQHWLVGLLQTPLVAADDHVKRIIQTELALADMHGCPVIVARSKTGQILLDSLLKYCESYDQWQFRRWLHQAKPHHFNPPQDELAG